MSKILFEETLQLRQPQLWIPLLVLFAVILGTQAYFLTGSPRDFTIRLIAFAICLVVFCGVAALLYFSRLDIKVTPSGLHTRFYPLELSFRDVEWKDINQMRITTVRPLRDFGGWGLRLGRNSKAYIVTGDKYVGLELADGYMLYINTLEPEKFLSALTHGRETASQKLP